MYEQIRFMISIADLFLTIVTEDDDSDGKSKLNGSQSDSDIGSCLVPSPAL